MANGPWPSRRASSAATSSSGGSATITVARPWSHSHSRSLEYALERIARQSGAGLAAEPEPASGILGRDRGENGRQLAVELVERAGALGPQQGLDLGPARLDRAQVGRVARQQARLEAGRPDRLADGGGLVRREVVHDHERARTVAQRRRQDLLHEGPEHGRGGRGGDGHHRGQPAQAEGADQRQAAPAAGRHRAAGPLAAPGPGEAARHARVDAALVDEDQLAGVEAAGGDLPAPGGTLLGEVGAVLFGGPERLFLRGQPRRWSARHSAEGLHRRPVRAASPSASSASVASPRSASTPSSAARASPPPSSGRPPLAGLAARRPSSRACRSRSCSVDTPTAKRRATSARLPSRRSRATSARSRRSAEYGRGIVPSVEAFLTSTALARPQTVTQSALVAATRRPRREERVARGEALSRVVGA